MMVPRSFPSKPAIPNPDRTFNEKDSGRKNSLGDGTRSSKQSLSSSPVSMKQQPVTNVRSNPVQIPTRNVKLQPQIPKRLPPSSQSELKLMSASQPIVVRRGTPQDVLSATAIPVRRKPKARTTQRLPKCDYVADFSKLLLDDIKTSTDRSSHVSHSSPHFDSLFGHIDELVEGQMIVGSEGLDAAYLSPRSMSSESLPSLPSPNDYLHAEATGMSPSTVQRTLSDRRLRQMAAAEEAAEHPLMHQDDDDSDTDENTSGLLMLPTSKKPSEQQDTDKRSSSFKSSLTASLKALKTAAQSMSAYTATTPVVRQGDYRTQSFFDIQPSLTDDRRPPPSENPPSPALRRYLNPRTTTAPDSPAQLHFWVEDRASKSSSASASPKSDNNKHKLKVKKKYLKHHDSKPASTGPELPSIVPLATCIPPTIRTAHASSPPIWLAPDGTPSNKHTAPQIKLFDEDTGLRQREPRENRDFLRVFIAEMQMRKKGKLEDNIPGRAVLWLPPVKEDPSSRTHRLKSGSVVLGGTGERWRCWTPEDL